MIFCKTYLMQDFGLAIDRNYLKHFLKKFLEIQHPVGKSVKIFWQKFMDTQIIYVQLTQQVHKSWTSN